jgi:N-methylhydantoinase A
LRLYPRQLLGAIPLLFSWELAADRDDIRRTWSSVLNAFLHPAMERFLFSTELEAKGRADLLRQGLASDAIAHRLELDMRYGNQLVTTAVVADRTRLRNLDDVMALIELFAEDYARRFGAGSESPEAGIRITTIRVASYVEDEKVEFDASLPVGDPTPAHAIGSRQCHFADIDGAVDTPVYDQTALDPGLVVLGPGVVTNPTTTYLVEPGWRLETGAHGAIWFLADLTSREA